MSESKPAIVEAHLLALPGCGDGEPGVGGIPTGRMDAEGNQLIRTCPGCLRCDPELEGRRAEAAIRFAEASLRVNAQVRMILSTPMANAESRRSREKLEVLCTDLDAARDAYVKVIENNAEARRLRRLQARDTG